VECPRIAQKPAQVYRLGPDWKAYRPLLMGSDAAPGDALQQLGRNRSDLWYIIRRQEGKMEIPGYTVPSDGIGLCYDACPSIWSRQWVVPASAP
jgi:hypothetical protein